MTRAVAESTTPGPIDRKRAAAIVALVGKGLSASEIVRILPSLAPQDVRAALLEAADVMGNFEASLPVGDDVDEILTRARQCSALGEEEAMELAVSETRAARQARSDKNNE